MTKTFKAKVLLRIITDNDKMSIEDMKQLINETLMQKTNLVWDCIFLDFIEDNI